MNETQATETAPAARRLIQRHLLEGWGQLFLFSLLGVGLEVLLAFKSPLYVNAENETRHLLFRLAHAHGTGLALLHLALAWTWSQLTSDWFPQPAGLVSGCMTAASLLIPAGFFLAGLSASASDPGVAIALVPAGVIPLLVALGVLTVGLVKAVPKS